MSSILYSDYFCWKHGVSILVLHSIFSWAILFPKFIHAFNPNGNVKMSVVKVHRKSTFSLIYVRLLLQPFRLRLFVNTSSVHLTPGYQQVCFTLIVYFFLSFHNPAYFFCHVACQVETVSPGRVSFTLPYGQPCAICDVETCFHLFSCSCVRFCPPKKGMGLLGCSGLTSVHNLRYSWKARSASWYHWMCGGGGDMVVHGFLDLRIHVLNSAGDLLDVPAVFYLTTWGWLWVSLGLYPNILPPWCRLSSYK